MKKVVLVTLNILLTLGLILSGIKAACIKVCERTLATVEGNYITFEYELKYLQLSGCIHGEAPRPLYVNTLRRPAHLEPGQDVRIYYLTDNREFLLFHKIELLDRRTYYGYNRQPVELSTRLSVFAESATPCFIIAAAEVIVLVALRFRKKKQTKSPAASAQ